MNTSLKKFSIVLKQEGTSRQERYMPALHESSTLLDSRQLPDILLYMRQYAKNLLFIDPEKDDIDFEESWEDFFSSDPVLLIAGVANLDIKKVKEEYDNLNGRFQNFTNVASFAELVQFVFARFQEINHWFKLAPADSMLHQDLSLYIKSYLQKDIDPVKEMLLYSFDHVEDDQADKKKNALNLKYQKVLQALQAMDMVWKLDIKEKLLLRESLFTGNNEIEKLTAASIPLRKIFETVFYVTQNISQRSAKYFDETIGHKQNHSPHVALVLTFIKLFQYQQAELNKLPQRLLNFYYRDVLKITPKNAVPDEAVIVIELAKGFTSCLVQKGTKVSAGKDKNNRELVYAVYKDVVINQAKVTQLRTGFIDRDATNNISNFYTANITALTDVPAGPTLATVRSKMFGDTLTAPAHIGFAIASSQFFLSKGERNVVVSITSQADIGPLQTAATTQLSDDFEPGIIRLLLTGEKGWIDSAATNSGIQINTFKKISSSVIALNFTISIAQEQAIIGFDPKLHEGNFNTFFPVMKCLLQFPDGKQPAANEAAVIYQLNILQQLQVTETNISVQAGNIDIKASFDGVRDLLIENDETVINSKKPFYPFTPIPKVNTAFYIGCKDLFYKKIQLLSINIEWLLPDNFRGYYQKYHPPYDSNKFMASLSYLQKNKWKKYKDISLIDINTGDPTLRAIKINFEKSSADDGLQDDNIPSFDNTKKNGTLQLKLGYPDFGHSVYPQLITAAVMDKAKAGNVDYYKLVKKRLHDDIFTIELPPDLNQRNGPLKVVYDILANLKDDAQARAMLINALSDIISRNNDTLEVTKKPEQQAGIAEDRNSEVIVHDQNFIERMLRIFRKTNIAGEGVHNDKDKQGVDDIAANIEGDIYDVADFILPSKNEMNNLIITEVNKNINQTVANAVVLILGAREETKAVDPERTAKILTEEFGKARKVINDMIAKKIATSLSASEIPPPPYAPIINTISINYQSSKDMARKDGDKMYHLTMAGSIAETSLWNDENGNTANNTLLTTNNLLPQPLSAKKNEKQLYMQGMLFIGIASLLPNQNISLLFQMAEGTKGNDSAPPTLFWFYLRDNEWVQLPDKSIISDSTYNLQGSGIMEFALPADATNTNTFFNTANLFWLCAAVAENPNAFPFLTDVKAQAAVVVFEGAGHNPQHLALPLPAGQINKLVDDLPKIKKIVQPVPSFNGRPAEAGADYFIRVSERLRHKERAINNWDYERLVLEAFPVIFKIKCLNNYCNGHFATGHVTVVPIPDLQNKSYSGSNILVPKTNYTDLKRIETFLSARSSPFVCVHAINPKPEYVQIKCKVKLYTGVDRGFYLKKLHDDVTDFLTPWSTGTDKLSFSGKVYASSIITFIDKREYVDYVTELVMFQYTEKENGQRDFVFNKDKLASLVETELTTDHSILVSAPTHQIELVD